MQLQKAWKRFFILVASIIGLLFVVLWIIFSNISQRQESYRMKHIEEFVRNQRLSLIENVVNNAITEIHMQELHARELAERDLENAALILRLNQAGGIINDNRVNDLLAIIRTLNKDIDVFAFNMETGYAFDELGKSLNRINSRRSFERYFEEDYELSSMHNINDRYLIGFGISREALYGKLLAGMQIYVDGKVPLGDVEIRIDVLNNYSGEGDFATRIITAFFRQGDVISINTDNADYFNELDQILMDGSAYSEYISEGELQRFIYAKLYRPYDWVVSSTVSAKDINELTDLLAGQFRSQHSSSMLIISLICLLFAGTAITVFVFFGRMFYHHANNELKIKEEANRAKSAFLATMSHEIRTPMNAITGMTEMLLRSDLSEETRAFAQDIKHAGDNLISIINDILDISKIEAGRLEMIPVKYRLSSLVNDTVNIIRTRLIEKSIWLETYAEETLPNGLIGDEVRIRQILINLLSNAVKYTDRGSITFGITKEKLFEDSSQVLLKIIVADTGKGIKPEDQEKLFKDFVQVDTLKNKGIEGTGLGLAITKRLVDAMGGRISVESEYGKGSIFTVILPQNIYSLEPVGRIGSSITNRDVKPFEIVNNYSNSRILIVDDLPANLKVAEGLLEPYKAVIDVCESGAEAVELVKYKKFDLIFMDHMMPEMDGIEAAKIIREWEKERQLESAGRIPIVALTANAVSGMKEKFIENGFDDFLAKPIDIISLDQVLERWIGEKGSREQGVRNKKQIIAAQAASAAGSYAFGAEERTESGKPDDAGEEQANDGKKQKQSIFYYFKVFIMNVATSGRYSEDGEFSMSDYYVRYVLMNFIIFFGSFLLIAFTVNNIKRGAIFDAISCGSMALIAVFTFILARTKVRQVVPVSIMMIFYGIFCALLTWYGDAQGAGVLFIYVYPVLTTMMLGMKSSIILSSCLILIVSLEMFVPGLSYYAYHIDISSRVVASYFLVFSVTLVMEITRSRKDKRIEEQNKWLQELKEKSEAANRAKSDFLANISHEIRTPMNTITGMNEMVLRSDISDEVRDYSQDIKKAGTHLTSIISDILNFTENGNINKSGRSNVISDIFINLPEIPGLDTAKGIAMTGRTIEKYKSVLSVFAKDAQNKLSFLQKIPEAENMSQFIMQTHALKSALSTIGAVELSLQAVTLEKAGEQADFDIIKEKLPLFVDKLKELVYNINNIDKEEKPHG